MGYKRNKQNRVSIISLAVKNQSFHQTTEKIRGKSTSRRGKNPVLSEGRDEDENYGMFALVVESLCKIKIQIFRGTIRKGRLLTGN